MEIILKLKKPHPKQQEILENANRFNHLRCGRRFGKTSLIEELCEPAIDGYPVGIWFPTYKDLSEVWKSVKMTFKPITRRKDEQLKQIEFVTGGLIDFWSMEDPDSGQGRKYKRAIIDEAAKAKRLMEAWGNTIRPTLTDYIGDAFILSRPKGKNNDFYRIEQDHKEFKNWSFFHYTTYDNPYIDRNEIEEAKSQADSLTFNQEYMAMYVDADDKAYLYSFSDKNIIDSYDPNPHLELWFSFDFNVDPMTCIVGQRVSLRKFVVFDEFRLENSGSSEMCDRLVSKYMGNRFMVTGDVSGKKRTTNTSGGMNDWRIIKQKLSLLDHQIKLRSANLPHAESRPLCNSVLQNAEFYITKNCEGLINDFRFANVDQNGHLIKDANNGLHFFDCGRYMIDANFPDFINNYKKYK